MIREKLTFYMQATEIMEHKDELYWTFHIVDAKIHLVLLRYVVMLYNNIRINKNINNIASFVSCNQVSCLCLVFIILGGIGYWWFIDSLDNAKNLPVKILKCESVNYENLSFLATYIIPLVCFPMETDREIFVMFSVIVIIGCIFVKTNLYYTNPSLILLGFNVYKVKTDSKRTFQQGIVIVRGKLNEEESIKYLSLSDNVYFGRKLKNANTKDKE